MHWRADAVTGGIKFEGMANLQLTQVGVCTVGPFNWQLIVMFSMRHETAQLRESFMASDKGGNFGKDAPRQQTKARYGFG